MLNRRLLPPINVGQQTITAASGPGFMPPAPGNVSRRAGNSPRRGKRSKQNGWINVAYSGPTTSRPGTDR